MAKTMRRYRMKMILADGRKVYAAKDGVIETKPGSAIKDVRAEAFQMFAFSPDLTLFAPVSEFAKMGVVPVQVARGEFELTNQPIDPEAIIPGRGGEDGNRSEQ